MGPPVSVLEVAATAATGLPGAGSSEVKAPTGRATDVLVPTAHLPIANQM